MGYEIEGVGIPTVVAFLRCQLNGDGAGAEAIVGSCNPLALAIATAAFMNAVQVKGVGSEAEWDRQLAAFQADALHMDAESESDEDNP